MTPTVAGSVPVRPEPVLVDPVPGDRVPEPVLVAARAADDKSGRDTVVLSLTEPAGITDAFVVTSGQNVRQVRTIVDEVERRVRAVGGGTPQHVEGLDDARWVLMDYGDFLVHVFLEEARAFYDLEHLWSGVPRLQWSAEEVVAAPR